MSVITDTRNDSFSHLFGASRGTYAKQYDPRDQGHLGLLCRGVRSHDRDSTAGEQYGRELAQAAFAHVGAHAVELTEHLLYRELHLNFTADARQKLSRDCQDRALNELQTGLVQELHDTNSTLAAGEDRQGKLLDAARCYAAAGCTDAAAHVIGVFGRTALTALLGKDRYEACQVKLQCAPESRFSTENWREMLAEYVLERHGRHQEDNYAAMFYWALGHLDCENVYGA